MQQKLVLSNRFSRAEIHLLAGPHPRGLGAGLCLFLVLASILLVWTHTPERSLWLDFQQSQPCGYRRVGIPSR